MRRVVAIPAGPWHHPCRTMLLHLSSGASMLIDMSTLSPSPCSSVPHTTAVTCRSRSTPWQPLSLPTTCGNLHASHNMATATRSSASTPHVRPLPARLLLRKRHRHRPTQRRAGTAHGPKAGAPAGAPLAAPRAATRAPAAAPAAAAPNGTAADSKACSDTAPQRRLRSHRPAPKPAHAHASAAAPGLQRRLRRPQRLLPLRQRRLLRLQPRHPLAPLLAVRRSASPCQAASSASASASRASAAPSAESTAGMAWGREMGGMWGGRRGEGFSGYASGPAQEATAAPPAPPPRARTTYPSCPLPLAKNPAPGAEGAGPAAG